MTTDDEPPTVRVPDGWERTSATTETMFDARVVSVRAHTVVHEDARLREAVRDRTGADGTWRFFFASRLRLRPSTDGSRAVTRLVTNRANRGFVDQLRDRGFVDVEEAESRRFVVDGTEADLTRYRARVPLTADAERTAAEPDETVAVTAEGYVAVWPAGGGFLMAGGAYPVAVEDDAPGDSLAEFLAPEAHREQLLEMIRSVSEAGGGSDDPDRHS